MYYMLVCLIVISGRIFWNWYEHATVHLLRGEEDDVLALATILISLATEIRGRMCLFRV